MKFTLDWLKEHLDTKHNDEKIIDYSYSSIKDDFLDIFLFILY